MKMAGQIVFCFVCGFAGSAVLASSGLEHYWLQNAFGATPPKFWNVIGPWSYPYTSLPLMILSFFAGALASKATARHAWLFAAAFAAGCLTYIAPPSLSNADDFGVLMTASNLLWSTIVLPVFMIGRYCFRRTFTDSTKASQWTTRQLFVLTAFGAAATWATLKHTNATDASVPLGVWLLAPPFIALVLLLYLAYHWVD